MLFAYQMLSPPTPPRADSTFEEGIVDDNGAQGWGLGVRIHFFVVVHNGEDGFGERTRPVSFVPGNTNDVQTLAESTKGGGDNN